jgi:mannose-6-phosphate isomerase-like protein (cupin superfamily)
MKGVSKGAIFLLAICLVFQPVLSWAGPGARVIPTGKVSLLSEGREVNQFQSEMPLPEGSLMLCNGSCLVQMPGIQLVAQDKAVFALTEDKDRWDLSVKSGQVHFAMRADAKPVSFHTPHDSLQTAQAIIPAGSGGVVRGSISVTQAESVLAIEEGTLQVMSADGTMLVQPGQTIRLAQAQMTPQQKEEQDKKKAGAAAAGAGAVGAGAAVAGAGAGGATIAGVGGAVVAGTVVTGIAVTAAAVGTSGFSGGTALSPQ